MRIGVDVGGTKVLAVAIDGPDEHPMVLAEARRATPAGDAALGSTIVAAIDDVAASGGRPAAIGLGLAGLVDRVGVLRMGPNLPGVVDFDVGPLVAERWPVPIVVENDATSATWAEASAGAARGSRHVVLVALGTGIGAGAVVDGALLRGAHGFAGEAGHQRVDPAGPECVCGRRGCWERFASGTGLAALAAEASVPVQRGEDVVASAQAGDEAAIEVLARFGRWVAVGIAGLVNVLDPEVVVVAGGVIEAGAVVLDPIRLAYTDLVLAPEHRPSVRIEAAAFGERAAAVGAAMLAGSAVA